jgi:hypothetical protein
MSPRAWWRVHRARLLQLWGVGIACSLLVRSASALVYLEFLQARTLELLLGCVYETTRSSSSLRDMGRQRWICGGSRRTDWRNT